MPGALVCLIEGGGGRDVVIFIKKLADLSAVFDGDTGDTANTAGNNVLVAMMSVKSLPSFRVAKRKEISS